MVGTVKKAVAIGIAGVTAVVVAAWRQVQRDNSLPGDQAQPSPAPAPAAEPASQSLFTPSVNEESTKAELYEVATELDIEGRSKMTKAELLAAIRAAS